MASTSIPTPRWVNHVFLSFRGEDTRKGFTGHLFAELERRGIKTFKDDHDLERGGLISMELIKAIEESMFAIIILSPNYASSTWCLDELQKILECKKTFGQIIFPLFYGVDSSDVRHQRGNFAEDFRKHEKKFRGNRAKVDTWKNALREIAGYSGWDSKGWNEAALVETIVDDIQKKVIPKLPSSTNKLVGIDSRKKELYSLLGMGLNDVRFIGIWGMGGIGKTTIARLVYEEIKEEFKFKDSCFLADIREDSEKKGLARIQRELLSGLNIRSTDFYNVHDGKNIVANSCCNKKVLLVLDDVSELSQLESLVGNQEWFGPGSRIIITSRNKHLLTTHGGVYETYEAKGLGETEALKLFCLKAFKQDQPKEEYWNLCREVVEYTGGLPLALKVLGSHLNGRTVEVWHSALKQIKSVPHSEILAKLKISYNSLEPPEKKLFLDIACFFKGMFKDDVINILESCGDDPKIGIEILNERSLVTLDRYVTLGDKEKYRLGMHDLLQKMGRHIVYEEYPDDPSRRSRLWSPKDIDQVLTKNKGTDKIQGIHLNLDEQHEAIWSPDAFSKTSQLRLLILRDLHHKIKFPLGLKSLPSSLKVLEWVGCCLKTLPLTNQLDEIVYLDLSSCEIEQLWHGTQCFGNLKSIDLSWSYSLKRSSDFAAVPNLEALNLSYCGSLTEVHPSLLHHKKLVLLNFQGCTRLKALPCKMEMSSLKKLNLSWCSKLKYLPEFGECMEHLSKLSLEGTALTKLPPSLGCLVGLANLNLKNCKNLVCLPNTVSKLNSLLILDVYYCLKLNGLSEGLKEMKCLEELYLSEIVIEEQQPLLTSYLGNLKIISCGPKPDHIKVWDFTLGPRDVLLSETVIEEKLPYLEHLKLISFVDIKSRREVRDYMAQRMSKRVDGPLLIMPKSINTFLLRLILLKFKESKRIPNGFKLPPFILCIPFLMRINLSYCSLSEDSLPDNFWQFPSLVELDLTGNNFVRPPSCISKLPKLQYLSPNWCEKLQQLPKLPSNIRVLDASKCASTETSKFNPTRPCCLFAFLLITMLLLALCFLPSMLIP